eukprot:1136615-Pelagomonas_calceolata.AAC.4
MWDSLCLLFQFHSEQADTKRGLILTAGKQPKWVDLIKLHGQGTQMQKILVFSSCQLFVCRPTKNQKYPPPSRLVSQTHLKRLRLQIAHPEKQKQHILHTFADAKDKLCMLQPTAYPPHEPEPSRPCTRNTQIHKVLGLGVEVLLPIAPANVLILGSAEEQQSIAHAIIPSIEAARWPGSFFQGQLRLTSNFYSRISNGLQ